LAGTRDIRWYQKTRRGGAYQKERAAAGRSGDPPDAALVDDLAGPQHVLSEQRLEAAESESMSRAREIA